MAQELWHNKAELLAEAKARGFAASKDLIDDWIDKGLLGEAGNRAWLGRGRGSVAQWSSPQLDLFLTLLDLRQCEHGKVGIGPLCNIPTWKWLYFGNLGGVFLQQVQRAMRTWVAFRSHIPPEKIQRGATKLVRQIKRPGAGGKQALIRELTAITTLEKRADKDMLRYYLEPVITPSRPRGARRMDEEEIEFFSTMIPTRLDALSDYDAIDRLPDGVWEWARVLLLVTIIQRFTTHSALTDELVKNYSYYADRITINTLCGSACYYLLTLLAIAQQRQFTRESVGYTPFLDPDAWRCGEASATSATRVVSSILFLPNGCHVPYLRNDLLITYRGAQQHFSLDLPFI